MNTIAAKHNTTLLKVVCLIAVLGLAVTGFVLVSPFISDIWLGTTGLNLSNYVRWEILYLYVIAYFTM